MQTKIGGSVHISTLDQKSTIIIITSRQSVKSLQQTNKLQQQSYRYKKMSTHSRANLYTTEFKMNVSICYTFLVKVAQSKFFLKLNFGISNSLINQLLYNKHSYRRRFVVCSKSRTVFIHRIWYFDKKIFILYRKITFSSQKPILNLRITP